MVQGLSLRESQPSTAMLEKMLDAAVEAKDPIRVEVIGSGYDQAEGLALLLKNQGIEKSYEIVGERERPYYQEQKARREKREAEAAKAKEDAASNAEEAEKKSEEAPKDKEVPNKTMEKK